MMKKKLMLLLDSSRGRKGLWSGGGQLLQMLMRRLSIIREDWVHDYCCEDKDILPKKKKERLMVLAANIRRIRELIRLNNPCVVVGMGKLPCEVLTDASLVSAKAGTCWRTRDFGKVWITYSPDAALYDPGVVVDIYGVLAAAAKAAGIITEFNPNIPMFNFEEYERYKIH